jgi:nitroimidazol reductase NimA-like FMN-containing flavoprotein (pyridoxamine 5'-phosphate oxidase superfamily)
MKLEGARPALQIVASMGLFPLAARPHRNDTRRMIYLTEVLDSDACIRYLGSASLGRVGLSISSLPAILPVNFTTHEGAILIRTRAGSKLDAAAHGALVAFEVDGFDEDRNAAWSVLVQGLSSEITDVDSLARACSVKLESWAVGENDDHFLRIELTNISGRRFMRSL